MASSQKTVTSNGLNQSLPNGNDLHLPDDFYPACWQDDERMENLFAPFRAKNVNPVNYETKMKFWKNLIQEYCKTRGSPVISLNELRSAFGRKGKKPYCLQTVLDEQLTEGSVKLKQQYMEAPLLTWSGWAVHKLVKAPLRWSFDKIKEHVISTVSVGNVDEHCEYVVIEVAKSLPEKLLNSFNANNECHTIVSKDDLIKKLTENGEFRLDGIETALHYLHCHQKASIQSTVIDQQEVILYKFAVTWQFAAN